MLFVLERTFIVGTYMVFCYYRILLESSAAIGIYRSWIQIKGEDL